jgi:hypothetical protein
MDRILSTGLIFWTNKQKLWETVLTSTATGTGHPAPVVIDEFKASRLKEKNKVDHKILSFALHHLLFSLVFV